MSLINRPYTVTVPANNSLPYGVTGEMFKVLSVTAAGLIASSDSGRGSFESIPLIAGRELRPGFEFNELRLENTTGSDITITLFVGSGELQDDSIVGTVEISSLPQPGELTPLAAHTVAAVPVAHTIAADTERRFLMLKAGPTNGGVLWLGGIDGDGIPIYAGETIVVQGTGAVSVIGDNPGDTLYCLEQVV